MNIPAAIKAKTPFSVIQYFESLIGSQTETNKKYEIIFLTSKKDQGSRILTNEEIVFVKENKSLFKEVINNDDGIAWEFNDFKNYFKKNKRK